MKKEKTKCPKCGSDFVGDIGYNNWQCYHCDNIFNHESRTGLEINF